MITGVGYQESIWSVEQTVSKIRNLTPLKDLGLFQRIELWVVPDENYAQKQGVGDWARIWSIRTVSKIRNLTPL